MQELPIEQINLTTGGGGPPSAASSTPAASVGGHPNASGGHNHSMLLLGNGGLAVMAAQHQHQEVGLQPHALSAKEEDEDKRAAEPMDVKPSVGGWPEGDMKQQPPWSGGLQEPNGPGKMGGMLQPMLGSPPPTPSSVGGLGSTGCEAGGSHPRSEGDHPWPENNGDNFDAESEKMRFVAAHHQELARLSENGGLRMDPPDLAYREFLERQNHLHHHHHHHHHGSVDDEQYVGGVDGTGYGAHLLPGPPHSPSMVNDGNALGGDPRSPNDNVEDGFSPEEHLHGHHHLHHHHAVGTNGNGAAGGGVLMHNGEALVLGGVPGGNGGAPSATTSKKSTSRRNAWGNLSYADLITQAIMSSPEKRLTLSQVYDWMVQNITYFKDKGDSNSSAGWKNSIRHNLSLHNKFVRVQNEGTGKSSWWMINPDAAKTNGKSSRRRSTNPEGKGYDNKRRGRAKKGLDLLRNGPDSTPSPNGLDVFPPPDLAGHHFPFGPVPMPPGGLRPPGEYGVDRLSPPHFHLHHPHGGPPHHPMDMEYFGAAEAGVVPGWNQEGGGFNNHHQHHHHAMMGPPGPGGYEGLQLGQPGPGFGRPVVFLAEGAGGNDEEAVAAAVQQQHAAMIERMSMMAPIHHVNSRGGTSSQNNNNTSYQAYHGAGYPNSPSGNNSLMPPDGRTFSSGSSAKQASLSPVNNNGTVASAMSPGINAIPGTPNSSTNEQHLGSSASMEVQMMSPGRAAMTSTSSVMGNVSRALFSAPGQNNPESPAPHQSPIVTSGTPTSTNSSSSTATSTNSSSSSILERVLAKQEPQQQLGSPPPQSTPSTSTTSNTSSNGHANANAGGNVQGSVSSTPPPPHGQQLGGIHANSHPHLHHPEWAQHHQQHAFGDSSSTPAVHMEDYIKQEFVGMEGGVSSEYHMANYPEHLGGPHPHQLQQIHHHHQLQQAHLGQQPQQEDGAHHHHQLVGHPHHAHHHHQFTAAASVAGPGHTTVTHHQVTAPVSVGPPWVR